MSFIKSIIAKNTNLLIEKLFYRFCNKIDLIYLLKN